jgi:site-specific DNA-cytosine methylase
MPDSLGEQMRVLVACEFSGVVRNAFRALGHDAWSCDLLPAEDGAEQHFTGDLFTFFKERPLLSSWWEWDLMIAHPPCTHLSVSGARWFKDKQAQQAEALEFVRQLMDAPILRICIENPVSIISSRIRKPDQIIQPFNFGDPYRKTTCLWLKNLPKLKYTSDLTTGEQKCWKEPPSVDRWKNRSRTYPGFARAMAEQWGSLSMSEAA